MSRRGTERAAAGECFHIRNAHSFELLIRDGVLLALK